MTNLIIKKARKAIKLVYPRLGLRSGDVILASFPKSGNTWMRFIWANMVSLMELNSREIDFNYLNNELVAEYDSDSYGDVEFECLPRVVKTHRCYNARAFQKNRSIYVVRHPGDVALSYFEYRGAKGAHETDREALKSFIRDREHGVQAWAEHVRSWQGPADVVVKYEELKEAPVAAIRRVLRRLELNHVPEGVIEKAVERSSFDKMKNIERSKGTPLTSEFDSDYRFIRKGRVGEWKLRFEKDDVNYMEDIIEKNNLGGLYSNQ